MARVPLTVVVTDPATGNAISGASVQVKTVAGANATLYSARTGGTTVVNPLTSDAAGRAAAWVDRGLYELVYSGGGLATWSEWLALTPGADAEIDQAWVGDPELAALAALASGADKLPYFTGAGAAALTDLTSYIRSLLGQPDAAGARVVLGAAASAVEAWHVVGAAGEPAFQNGWLNYGGGYVPARFIKDTLGIVHVTGVIKGGTASTTVFTLPAGYRPAYALMFPGYSDGTAIPRVDVDTGGNVLVAAGTNVVVTLAALSFLAEQ